MNRADQPASHATREEEPLCVECDFGVVYSLYQRPGKRGAPPRVILKVTWEETEAERSCTFEIDLKRERLVALGRKGNSLPAERFDSAWFCAWAREKLALRPE
jgi:hypothetical protein